LDCREPHFHTLVAEGVFEEQRDGPQCFVPLCEPPSDIEVARLLAACAGRSIAWCGAIDLRPES
jgi:hypothetical protein